MIKNKLLTLDFSLISNYNSYMETEKIISLAARIREEANRFILAELAQLGIKELAPSHGDILFVLYSSDSVTMGELKKRINRDKSTVTALVNKLVKLGYINRLKDYTDNRVTLVSLTPKGLALKPRFFEISDKLITKIYQGINQEQQISLVVNLERVLKNLKK